MDKLFYRPMLKEQSISQEFTKSLFPNLETMIQLHSKLSVHQKPFPNLETMIQLHSKLSGVHQKPLPGCVAQSVTCLSTDACLTAISGVASSIPARSHTFVEIDHEIISTVIRLPSADSFKKGCCQLQAKVCARITGYPLVQACPGKECG